MQKVNYYRSATANVCGVLAERVICIMCQICWYRTREAPNTSITRTKWDLVKNQWSTELEKNQRAREYINHRNCCRAWGPQQPNDERHVVLYWQQGAYLFRFTRGRISLLVQQKCMYLCTAITAECIFLAFPVTNYPHSKSAWLLWLELGTPVWQNYGRLHGSNHGVELYQLSLQWPQQMRHTYRWCIKN